MKKLILIILTLTLVLSMNVAYANLYPTTVIIRKFDYLNDLVICEDYNGHGWIFEGIEDWSIDDIVSMIMDDMNTPIIEDDAIIMTRYSGCIKGV